MEALEALKIATINVLSAGLMASGGLLWALDIASLDEMRTKARRAWGGVDGAGRDEKADEEIEEWLATVLARKDQKAKGGDETKDNKAEQMEEWIATIIASKDKANSESKASEDKGQGH